VKQARGGAVVELALWMGILTLLLASSLAVSRALFWRLRLISAARIAATLAGTGRVAPDAIERELKLYLQQFPDSDSTSLDFTLSRFLGVPSASFYQLMSVRLRLTIPFGTLEESVQVQQEDV
jgi:hypothetical protein